MVGITETIVSYFGIIATDEECTGCISRKEKVNHSISIDAIAEAVKLAGEAFIKHADEFVLESAAV